MAMNPFAPVTRTLAGAGIAGIVAGSAGSGSGKKRSREEDVVRQSPRVESSVAYAPRCQYKRG